MSTPKPLLPGQRVSYRTSIGDDGRGKVVSITPGRTGTWIKVRCADGKLRSLRPSQVKRY